MKHSPSIYFLLLPFLIHNITHSMDRNSLDELRELVAEIQDLRPKNNDEKICMDKMRETSKAILATASLTRPTQKGIVFFRSQQCPRVFQQLSADENGIILDTFIQILDNQPTKSIHQLLCICKSLTTFILDRQNTLRLYKELSFINKQSNENAIKTIQTKTARECFMIQKGFEQICEQTKGTISKQDALIIKNCNTDINFTYGTFSETQLARACLETEEKPSLARWLLENGADTTVRTFENKPIVHYLLNSNTPMSNKILTYFFASPSFDINHYYHLSRCNITAKLTIFYCFFTSMFNAKNVWCKNSKLNVQQKFQLKRLQLLLDNGADPELAGSMEVTPLMFAKTLENKKLIDMLEKAIVRKAKINRTMRKIRQTVADGTESLEQASQKIYDRCFVPKKKRSNSKRLRQANVMIYAIM